MDGTAKHRTVADVDGQRINILDLEHLLSAIFSRLRTGAGFTLATVNLDHLVKLRRDPVFRAAYRRITFLTADGVPVVYLGRRTAQDLKRVTGADMVKPVCDAAARAKVGIYLFGSTTHSLQTAAKELQHAYPQLIVSGYEAPPDNFDYASDAAVECGKRIAASGAQLCFVCLGAPKQELFSDRMSSRHPQIGFLCVGAALDFIANTQSRAPAFMQNHGLEWFWRFLSNPRRFFRRYAECAILFTWMLVAGPLAKRTASSEKK